VAEYLNTNCGWLNDTQSKVTFVVGVRTAINGHYLTTVLVRFGRFTRVELGYE